MAFPREKCISVFQSGTPRTPLLRFPFPSYSSRNVAFLAPLPSHPAVTDGKSHRIDPLRLESIIRPAFGAETWISPIHRCYSSSSSSSLFSTPSSSSSSSSSFSSREEEKLRRDPRERERERKGWNRSRDISRCVTVANEERILIRIEGRVV